MLDKIRIVLVNTSHPGNIGAAARAMKNMGLSQLVLVDPKEFPSYEAYSRAASADDILGDARVVATLDEALAGCVWAAGTSARMRTVQWPLLEPRACASRAVEACTDGDAAIVFGRERTGLSNEELEKCNALVNIPSNPDYSSLNVAAAVQVLCYELRLAARDIADELHTTAEVSRKHKDDVPASIDQLDGMYQHMHQALQDIQFFGTSNPDVIMRRLKGLFNRAQTTRREVAILRGIFSAAQGRKATRQKHDAS